MNPQGGNPKLNQHLQDRMQTIRSTFTTNAINTTALAALREMENSHVEQIRKLFAPAVHWKGSYINADVARALKGFAGADSLLERVRGLANFQDAFALFKQQKDRMPKVDALVSRTVQAAHQQLRDHNKSMIDALVGTGSAASYLKTFEAASKRWAMPAEVVSFLDSFKQMQEGLSLERLALPTIQLESAACIAASLGSEGIQANIDLLGIQPDGSIREPVGTEGKGILSKTQADVLTLISFLLIFVIFFYQEHGSSKAQESNETSHQLTQSTLEQQSQQIAALTALIEQALVGSVQTPVDRYVVRERVARVTARPEPGAPVQAELLPREVVEALGASGKWVQVEYYHWQEQEYRQGWVLKKYLKRVPANHQQQK